MLILIKNVTCFSEEIKPGKGLECSSHKLWCSSKCCYMYVREVWSMEHIERNSYSVTDPTIITIPTHVCTCESRFGESFDKSHTKIPEFITWFMSALNQIWQSAVILVTFNSLGSLPFNTYDCPKLLLHFSLAYFSTLCSNYTLLTIAFHTHTHTLDVCKWLMAVAIMTDVRT